MRSKYALHPWGFALARLSPKEKYGVSAGDDRYLLDPVPYSIRTMLLVAQGRFTRSWCYAPCSWMTSRHGATFAALLASELADSALLGYLRRRTFVLRHKSQRISPSAPKKQKKTATRMGNCLFGAEGEIRTLAPVNPTYTLSRGASSTS